MKLDESKAHARWAVLVVGLSTAAAVITAWAPARSTQRVSVESAAAQEWSIASGKCSLGAEADPPSPDAEAFFDGEEFASVPATAEDKIREMRREVALQREIVGVRDRYALTVTALSELLDNGELVESTAEHAVLVHRDGSEVRGVLNLANFGPALGWGYSSYEVQVPDEYCASVREDVDRDRTLGSPQR